MLYNISQYKLFSYIPEFGTIYIKSDFITLKFDDLAQHFDTILKRSYGTSSSSILIGLLDYLVK